MNATLIKVAKILVPIASMGITLVSSILSEKELDEKVARKVAEALARKEV